MVNWFKNKIEKSSFRYLIAWGVSVFVLIVAIIFFLYTYYSTKNEQLDRDGRNTEFRADQMVAQVDDRLQTFEKYYISSMDDEAVDWLLKNDFKYSDYSRYKSVMDILGGKKLFVDYVGGYTLVDFNSGWVLSSKGLVRFDELVNPEVLTSLYDYSVENNTKRFWSYKWSDSLTPNTVADKTYRKNIDDSNLSLIMRLPHDSINTHALVMIKLKMNEWKSWVDSLLEEEESVVVISSEGEIVYTTDSRLNESALEYVSDEMRGYRNVKNKDIGELVLSGRKSGVTGWSYVVFKNSSGNMNKAHSAAWIGMLVQIVVISIMVAIGARLVYNPVGNLVKNISDSASATPEGNEFNYITSHFSGLKYDKEQLEIMVDSQGSRIQEMFELRLITENIKSEDDWNDYFEGLHLPNYPYFATAVMVLDLSNEQEIQTSLNEDAICLRIVDKMPETLKSYTWMPPVYNSCTIFCLFGAENENELLTKICDFHDKIQEFTYAETGYRVIMGVSNTCTEHRKIRRAYRESISALTKMQPREVFSETSGSEIPECRFYISTESDKGEAYSNSFENDIATAIKAVDKEKAYDVTNRFARHLNTVTSTDVATLYIMRYVNSIMITAIEANIPISDIAPDGIRNAYRELISAVEPARVRRYIKMTFIDPIILAISERMKDDSYNIMGSIEQLVEESKGDILLAECAEKLGVHQTHIWKILKMEKGLSFTEYTEKYKIEEAKKLLLQTNMTVQEIATALNYSNAQNFIRFFSKVTGVTPGKFRKLY